MSGRLSDCSVNTSCITHQNVQQVRKAIFCCQLKDRIQIQIQQNWWNRQILKDEFEIFVFMWVVRIHWPPMPNRWITDFQMQDTSLNKLLKQKKCFCLSGIRRLKLFNQFYVSRCLLCAPDGSITFRCWRSSFCDFVTLDASDAH